MTKIKLGLAIFASLALVVLVFQPVLAGKNFQAAQVINIRTGESVASIVVPAEAVGRAHVIVPLGSAFDNGREVEGYAIVHYAKPDKPGNGKGGGKGGGGSDPVASCYDFLANGARWRTTESYVVAPDIDSVAVARDLDAWDSRVAFNIFGNQDIVSIVDGADTASPDGKNEVMFGDISSDGAIAVAIVWGIFRGPPKARELVEYDVVFDNVDYVWGDAAVDPSVMDFENIATHEFGHTAGLSDLYESQCSAQTMYGYADYGETGKRTLEIGDINGITALYK